MAHYLMLNKDDITEVCGTITPKEVRNELGITGTQFTRFVETARVFRGKYILVEDETPKQTNEIYSRLILETAAGKQYFARNDGIVYVVYKNGNVRVLKQFICHKKGQTYVSTKAGKKQYVVKNLMAQLFIREWKKGDVVIQKDNNPKNCAVSNLIVIPKEVYAVRTGPMSRSQPVGLFEDGKLVRKWRSARKAGQALYCSYQTINDYCNGKVKNKEYDVRWI